MGYNYRMYRSGCPVIGWTYEADIHCNGHAIERFTVEGLLADDTVDSEGNPPNPIFRWDESGEYCRECIDDCIAGNLPTEYANIRD